MMNSESFPSTVIERETDRPCACGRFLKYDAGNKEEGIDRALYCDCGFTETFAVLEIPASIAPEIDRIAASRNTTTVEALELALKQSQQEY